MTIAKQAKRLEKSQWTRVHPKRRERHWSVVDVRGPEGVVTLEAVLTKSRIELGWRELEDRSQWQPGWHRGES